MAEEKQDKQESAVSKPDDDDLSASSNMDKLRDLFSTKLGIGSKEKGQQLLEELSVKGVADFIKNDEKCKNVIVMCGAGVSTSAGIPDFRSPGSGLYDNLQEFNLPDPQAIFEISYFRKDPRPFYALAKKLLPSEFKPTLCHYFIRLLQDKGKLLRVYTQNIDTLERTSGISEDKIVEAHGTFYTSHCINCNKEFSFQWMKEHLDADVPKCPDCDHFVKPDIVFFGENLPHRFFQLVSSDFSKCDLLIVLGTSLVVQPFASLVDRVNPDVPRLLINKEKVGQTDFLTQFLGMGNGLDYDSSDNYRDVAWLGLCDDGCQLLAEHLGWTEELCQLQKGEHKKLAENEKPEAKSEWL